MEDKYCPTGQIMFWTGNGKGKTTSAIGLTVRALAYDWKILVVQMLKNDCKAFKLLKDNFSNNVTLRQYGVRKITLPNNLVENDYELIKDAWQFIEDNYESHQLVILDESLCALNLGLYKKRQLWDLIENCKEKKINLVCTGRVWSRDLLHRLVDKSTLCTECKPRKHYFTKNCPKCHREFADNYDYNYCPYCTTELKSLGAQFAIEL